MGQNYSLKTRCIVITVKLHFLSLSDSINRLCATQEIWHSPCDGAGGKYANAACELGDSGRNVVTTRAVCLAHPIRILGPRCGGGQLPAACSYRLHVRSGHALLLPVTYFPRHLSVTIPTGVPDSCTATGTTRHEGDTASRTMNPSVFEDEIVAFGHLAGVVPAHRKTPKLQQIQRTARRTVAGATEFCSRRRPTTSRFYKRRSIWVRNRPRTDYILSRCTEYKQNRSDNKLD